MRPTADFIILGAGIIGLTVARELLLRGHKNILILEKESSLGAHASGRNSGVLHAGIYYANDSMKAKHCNIGMNLMKDFVRRKNLPLLETGKVICAGNEVEANQIISLHERAEINGALTKIIDSQELSELEPLAKSYGGKAIFSPATAVVQPLSILEALKNELFANGIQINFNSEIQRIKQNILFTNRGKISFSHLINCCGTGALKIAHSVGLGHSYRMLPFKGMYWVLDRNTSARISRAIYPVPNLKLPFLGVHVTKTLDGNAKLGPSALPAFGPENYSLFSNISFCTSVGAFTTLGKMYLKNQNHIREHIASEISKLTKEGIVKELRTILPTLQAKNISKHPQVGIRPQLVRTKDLSLEMDFQIESNQHQTHVLNSISPAFTCSMSLAKSIVDHTFRNFTL